MSNVSVLQTDHSGARGKWFFSPPLRRKQEGGRASFFFFRRMRRQKSASVNKAGASELELEALGFVI